MYTRTNWDIIINVANKAHRTLTGDVLDKFRYNNVTGDIWVYNEDRGLYSFCYNDKKPQGKFIDKWV